MFKYVVTFVVISFFNDYCQFQSKTDSLKNIDNCLYNHKHYRIDTFKKEFTNKDSANKFYKLKLKESQIYFNKYEKIGRVKIDTVK